MGLDEYLTESDPARAFRFDAPTSDAATRLYQRITAQPPAGRTARRLRARVMVPAAVAATAAGLAVALAVAVLPGSPAAPPSAAAAVLGQAAATAAAQPPRPALRPGQYLYIKTIETIAQGPGGFSSSPLGGPPNVGQGYYECVMTVQLWVAGNGSGRAVYTPEGSQRDAPAGRCDAFTYPFRNAAGEVIDLPPAVPANPARLERLIEHRYADGRPDFTTFAAVIELLESGEPPPITATLYRVLKLLPGIEDLGPTTDRIGRRGIGVGLTNAGVRYELIFDATTSAVLEVTAVVVTPQPRYCTAAFTMRARTFHARHKVIHVPAHRVPRSCTTPDPVGATGFTVVVSSGVVNSATATVPASGGAAGAS
jgi:hypothetical protein